MRAIRWVGFFLLLSLNGVQARHVGDLDADQVMTVRDLSILFSHIQGVAPLDASELPYADLDGDGAVNQTDADLLIAGILDVREPTELPLSTIRMTSPSRGEEDVAITREVIVHFTIPLGLNTIITPQQFAAYFGGEPILSRVELSGDRAKATLFFLEPLPSNARIQIVFDGTGMEDLLGRPFDANADNEPGGVATFFYDTLSITPLSGTAIRGRVFASQPGVGQHGNPIDVPLGGVTVTVDGAEETMRTVTDANGDFVLDPCPAGSFFVHIDGRTSPSSSFPNGRYYPFVGKEWFAFAGRTDNLATETGNIYLPEVCPGTLQTVSASEDTDIAFPQEVLDAYPELAGTELIVPPNSLFADDGTRGGMVGMAPVPPQRLPEPLPPGLDLPLVITIQTDGAMNFDQPVPVCFPNLPDPVSGETLPPGAESALWSFNHDIGIWEVVGSMTVTDDGRFVKTDPGVGVRQPGWHGPRPGSQATGEGPVDGSEEGDDSENPDGGDGEVNCPNTVGNSASRIIYESMKEIVSCGASLTKVTDAFNCTKTVLFTGADIVDKVYQFLEQLQQEEVSYQDSIKGFAVIKQSKDSVIAIFNDCLGFGSPSTQAENIFGCIQGAFNIANSVCDAVDPQPPPADLPEECEPSWLTSIGCEGVRNGKFVLDRAKTIVRTIKDFEKDFSITIICAAVDLLEQWIADNAPPAGDVRARGSATLTPEQVAELQVLLKDVEVEAGILLRAGSEYPDIGNLYGELYRIADKEMQNASRELNRIGRPMPGLSYWAIDIEGLTLRGKVTPKGRINAILGPNQTYTLKVFHPQTGLYDEAPGFSAANGRSSYLSATILDPRTPALPDQDGDGVPDPAEYVLGTLPDNPDTDGDGINDLAEALQGTNPTEGLLVETGTIANAPVTGSAQDVCAVNDIAITANGGAGVSVYNVFSGLNPTRIAEFNVGGAALAVTCYDELLAVAAFQGGVSIIDISDPTNPRRVRSIPLRDSAVSIASSGPTAYAGTQRGSIYAIDMYTGAILDQVNIGPSQVEDLAVSRETLYALQRGKLSAFDLKQYSLAAEFTTPAPATYGGHRPRLFAGGDTLYAAHLTGFNLFDISSRTNAPVRLTPFNTAQRGWKQFITNGSGLGLAPTGQNSTFDGPHDLYLFSVDEQGRDPNFLLSYPTPGFAMAAAVYNGLGYVADSGAGLSVVNYRSFDTLGIAPSIDLSSHVDLQGVATVEEGTLLRITAEVTDDVQIRQVRFFIDGEEAVIDGGYPFEHRFVVPLVASQATVRVQARAEDTGGNVALSPEYTLTLTPDSQPPLLVNVSPFDGALIFPPSEIWARFNELIDLDSLVTNGLSLVSYGSDRMPGGGDDFSITNEVIRFREESQTAFLSVPDPLDPGVYRIVLSSNITDLAGNFLANPGFSEFTVASDLDTDKDGVPDDFESVLGLNKDLPDTDDDGTPDGMEDFDNDTLNNAFEILLGYDPRLVDTDGDGTSDGDEDLDYDGLTNGEESDLLTDPQSIDSDGDRFDDATEVASGTDPLDPDSGPVNLVSYRVVYVNAVNSVGPGTIDRGTSVASRAPSYINFVPGEKPATVSTAASTRVPAFLNFVPVPPPASVSTSTASGTVSYENQ